MKIAAIIVNFNDEEDTQKFTKSISEYSIIDRVVVVDNKSTTIGAFEKLKELENNKVIVIQSEKNGGYNYGNNFGIKYLESQKESYDYFLICNPDIKVSEAAISHSIDVLEKNDSVAIVAPRMYNKNGFPMRRSSWKIRTFWRDVVHSTRLLEILFYSILRSGEYKEWEYKAKELEVEAIAGSFFIIKSKVLKQMDYFDDNVFLFYEEDILAKKLKDANYKIISLNSERFIHYESQTIGKTFSYFTKMVELFKSKMYFQKNYNHINIAQSILYYILFVFRMIELAIEIPLRKILKK